MLNIFRVSWIAALFACIFAGAKHSDIIIAFAFCFLYLCSNSRTVFAGFGSYATFLFYCVVAGRWSVVTNISWGAERNIVIEPAMFLIALSCLATILWGAGQKDAADRSKEKDAQLIEFATLVIVCALGAFLIASLFSLYLGRLYAVDAETLRMLRVNSLLIASASFLFLRIERVSLNRRLVFGGLVAILLSGCL